jgi:hypothetical protein
MPPGHRVWSPGQIFWGVIKQRGGQAWVTCLQDRAGMLCLVTTRLVVTNRARWLHKQHKGCSLLECTKFSTHTSMYG